jgi:hypothetical protein
MWSRHFAPAIPRVSLATLPDDLGNGLADVLPIVGQFCNMIVTTLSELKAP